MKTIIYLVRPLSIVSPDITIFSEASKQDWGATCQGISTGGNGLIQRKCGT